MVGDHLKLKLKKKILSKLLKMFIKIG